MPIVTLINDWKSDALYSSMIKGKLISIHKDIQILDLISAKTTFDFSTVAFVLKKSYKNFPNGTIHLNFVTNSNKPYPNFLIGVYDEHYFISEDNGFLSIVFENKEAEIYTIDRTAGSFDELEYYPLLVKMILTKKLNKLGSPNTNYFHSSLAMPAILPNRIIGHIIYIDNYGNLITNFTKEFVEKNTKNKNFKVVIQSERNVINKISENYSQVQSGDLLCLFNSIGHLEIAMKDSNMAELMSISKKDQVSIVFEEEKKQGTLF